MSPLLLDPPYLVGHQLTTSLSHSFTTTCTGEGDPGTDPCAHQGVGRPDSEGKPCLYLLYYYSIVAVVGLKWVLIDWPVFAQVLLALGDYMNVQCHSCIGGTNVGEDIRKLDYGQHVVAGTPGRVFG